jgi:hypothetical protein
MHVQIGQGATTLVWIDSEEAIIVRWADRATVERVRSEARDHGFREGRGPVATSGRHGDGGTDLAERARRDDLRLFVGDVADRVPPTDDVTVVGPGVLRGRLERTLRADDRRHGRRRQIHSAAADRLTEQELVARVRTLAGDEPPRRGVAAD